MQQKLFQLLPALTIICGLVSPVWANTYEVRNNSCDPAVNSSLAWAIAQSNINPGPDVITFAVSDSITVFAPLILSGRVAIEGGGVTIGAYDRSRDVFRLYPGSEGSTLTGMAIVDADYGIWLISNNNWVKGCCLGTDWADSTNRGNSFGVCINSSYSQVGGAGTGEGNLISGNINYAIFLYTTSGTRIQGNRIGTTRDGMAAIPTANGQGVVLYQATGTLIGGNSLLGEGNLISGNALSGVQLDYSRGNTICGNIIGPCADQTYALTNNSGISVGYSSYNWIGLPRAGYQNIICGNYHGIHLTGSYGDPSNFNVFQNNLIGINEVGAFMGNQDGIYINDAHNNLIGGNRASGLREYNIIAANTGNGIRFSLRGDGNTICGNYIGVDPAGTPIGNSVCGISLMDGVTANLIGGPNQDSNHLYGNVISGHNLPSCTSGIFVASSPGNVFQGNWIGLDTVGTGAVPNRQAVMVLNSSLSFGGTGLGCGNVISGNIGYGLLLLGSCDGSTICGNYFGTNAAGTSLVPNSPVAIMLNSVSGCRIGGASLPERNLVCGQGTGIELYDSGGNTLTGNWINVLADGRVPGTGLTQGIYLHGSSAGNYLGLPGTRLGNLINTVSDGICVESTLSRHNGFFGNTICAGGALPINLVTGANENKSAPVIHSGNACWVTGTAGAGDMIEIFLADKAAGANGGSRKWAGSAVADSSGNWGALPSGPVEGDVITALATDQNNNTSMFALNVSVFGPTPTPTNTPTSAPTVAPTSTPTPHSTAEDMSYEGDKVLAFPNPAKEQVTFVMNLEQDQDVRIHLYNLAGERIGLLSACLSAGNGRTLVWDCRTVAPGIYLARVIRQGKEIKKVKVAVTR